MSGASSDSRSMSAACWVETTTVSRRTGLSPSYSMVTWVLPSGRRYGIVPSLRTVGQPLGEPVRERDRQRHQLGGLVAGVAEHQALVAGALPVERVARSPSTRVSNASSTPWAMSGDCAPIETETPQEAPSKPFFDES